MNELKMRATPKKFIKMVLLTSLMCFVVVNLNLFLRAGTGTQYDGGYFQQEAAGGVVVVHMPEQALNHSWAQRVPNSSALEVGPHVNRTTVPQQPFGSHLNLSKMAPHEAVHGDLRLLLPSVANRSLDDIKTMVRQANREQRILNLDRYELAASDSTVVVVVQVHNRVEYLHHLIESLRKASHIEQALLVFSHDFFADDINKVISTIDFCPVS